MLKPTRSLALFALFGTMGTAAAGQISNGGFECGDFTGWSVTVPSGGFAGVVGSHGAESTTYTPVEGASFMLLKTDGPGSYTFARQSVTLGAGCTVTGYAAFDAHDYVPFNDNARVRVFDDATNTVVATPWFSNVGVVGDYGDGPWTAWSWTAPTSGSYTFEFGVANSLDGALDSHALFDGFQVSVVNGSFETGDFSGWSVFVPPGGSAGVAGSHSAEFSTYTPVSGSDMAVLKTDGPGSYTYIQQTVCLDSGDVIGGYAAFDAHDYAPFADNGRVRIFDDATNTLIATPWYDDVLNVGDYGDGPWTFWSWTAPADGSYTVEFGVANDLDSAFDSHALFDNFAILADDDDEDGDGLSTDDEIDIYGTDPCDADTDDDGLTDGDEVNIYATDPLDDDSDDDGLLDGTEVGLVCGEFGDQSPDPNDADTDDDTVSDGDEVTNGTDPCNADSDGDCIDDGIDDEPLTPGASSGVLEDMTRAVGVLTQDDVGLLFTANNANAKKGKRNSLATRINNAANAIAKEKYDAAFALLSNVLAKVDTNDGNPDWVEANASQQLVADEIACIIANLILLMD